MRICIDRLRASLRYHEWANAGIYALELIPMTLISMIKLLGMLLLLPIGIISGVFSSNDGEFGAAIVLCLVLVATLVFIANVI